MGEVLLRDRLAARELPGVVRSAGRYFEGRGAEPFAVDAMARRGLDLRGFSSSIVSSGVLSGADLVLGMAREHVREAVVLQPDVFDRIFTLKELARLGAEAGGPQPGEHFPSFVERVGAGRPMAAHLGSSRADDIDDPMGRSSAHFEATAVEIEQQVDHLVELLAPTLAPLSETTPRG
jgi:protein-tyrosine phosphatase